MTQTEISTQFFERSPEPSPGGSTTSPPTSTLGDYDRETYEKIWEKVKSLGIEPTAQGESSDDWDLRLEFLTGAEMLGMALVDITDAAAVAELAELDPPQVPLQPQQLRVADALNAGIRKNAIEMPRRSTKSTSVFAVTLGRMVCRPRYKVTFSAQTGTDGRQMLEDWVIGEQGIEVYWPELSLDTIRPTSASRNATKASAVPRGRFTHQPLPGFAFDVDEPDDLETEAAERTHFRSGHPVVAFSARLGNSGTQIRFRNRSVFLVLKPEAAAYRSKAADFSWLDEAQEHDPEEGELLLAGLLPLQDTRPGAQTCISGTAGPAKAGPFWAWLKKLRHGLPNIGGIDFYAPEDTEWKIIENIDTAMALLRTMHPGVDTLTNIQSMRENWEGMAKPKWAREYASMWPDVGEDIVIDPDQWDKTALQRIPTKPARVAFGMDIQPGGGVAAIAAAWRDAQGHAYVLLVDHQLGNSWIVKRAQHYTRTAYRSSSVAFDKIAEGEATYVESRRQHPRPKMQLQTWAETAAGCVTFERELAAGTLRHAAEQVGLNDAVTVAKKREVKGNDRGVWIYTASVGEDVTPLLAAVRALRNWDQHFARPEAATETGIISA